MNRINEYIKSVGGIQSEQWKFYYGPTGIDKVIRKQGGIQNLTIDYTTDTNGRILSAAYNETEGYSGELFRNIGMTLARKYEEDYRRMCKALYCVGCD